ncbi:lon-related putative ATP-dependent protease [Clostridium punense]|uniref:endopeptidase La n=1 Tax=Clostridium punense TaxID=1054297 RepID=A0ABS4K1X0_9CLOT|nr:AAA family ATPase [Clostridium punense]MBP2021776.1 lon-related putative ATP-dependent protease [Clostridium punense]
MYKELTPKDIIYDFDINRVSASEEKWMLPQYSEAYKKIKTALQIDNDGYNIYLVDDYSKDRIKHIIEYVKDIFKDNKAPDDICYVVKDDDKQPIPIILSNGLGNEFKEALEELQGLYSEYTFQFYNDSENKEKDNLVDKIQKKRNEIINSLVEVSKNSGFDIKSNNGGFTFIPLNEGREMTEEEYEDLDMDEKDAMISKVNELKAKAKDILEQLKNMEANELKKIKEIMLMYLNEQIENKKENFRETFEDNKEAVEYLEYVCETIESNLVENYSINYDDDEEKINEIIYKYMINVIVDNNGNKTPPVIFEEDPNVTNLLGNIEYENHNNVYVSDVSLIKAGSLIKANGGCLIIRVNNLLNNLQSYYYLKKVLITEKIDLDYNKGYFELLALSGLKPKPIGVKQKVILIGDYETYDLLYTHDEDFRKIFKMRTEYKTVMEIDKNIKGSLVNEVNRFCAENNIKPLSNGAIKEIAKVLSRKAENKNKIFFDDYDLTNLILLANDRVLQQGKETIDDDDIIEVAYKKELIEEEILKTYKEKKMLISVSGSRVGQINGLSVIDTGYVSFGKPLKITCTCYKGDGHIIDTQRESNLSGRIHNKAISILRGFMSSLNGGYRKLPVDFHISFEQLYGIVDGDSASVAEVVCMISSLTKLPIKQNIAVTGSINQFGEVQPIGGVNEKIEGFFSVCKEVNTIEGKGVLIPASNKDDLVLCKEVEDAILQGKFKLYTMENIDDALQVLLDYKDPTLEKILKVIDKESKKYIEKPKTPKAGARKVNPENNKVED